MLTAFYLADDFFLEKEWPPNREALDIVISFGSAGKALTYTIQSRFISKYFKTGALCKNSKKWRHFQKAPNGKNFKKRNTLAKVNEAYTHQFSMQRWYNLSNRAHELLKTISRRR